MLPEIARRVIETYTQPGDLIVDPMCGIGTTLVEAVHLGRRAIGVELEDRWAGLARANLTHAQTQGAARCGQVLCGDARDLSRLLAHRAADLLLLSPPYANATLGDPRAGHGVERARACEGRRTTDADRAHAQELVRSCRYGKRPDNVAALPYRRADLVLVSPPPYACEVADVEPTVRRSGGLPVKSTANYGDSRENLAHARGHTYLTAMAEIYAACERVLKPGGFLVVVTKDTRERGKLRNLAGNTITLCQSAGLDYWQHVIALLAAVRDDELPPRVSFWQTLLRTAVARAERVQLVCHEDVLVFRKPPPGKSPNATARRAA